MIRQIVIGIFVLLLTAQIAQAQPIQLSGASPTTYQGIDAQTPAIGQSFTALNRRVRAAFWAYPRAEGAYLVPALMEVAGSSVGRVVWQGDPILLEQFRQFGVSPDVDLTPGATYLLSFSHLQVPGRGFAAFTTSPTAYSGGSLWLFRNGAWGQASGNLATMAFFSVHHVPSEGVKLSFFNFRTADGFSFVGSPLMYTPSGFPPLPNPSPTLTRSDGKMFTLGASGGNGLTGEIFSANYFSPNYDETYWVTFTPPLAPGVTRTGFTLQHGVNNGPLAPLSHTGYLAINADPVATIPTMSEWAMILLGVMLAGGAALTLQRRRAA